MTMLTRMGHRNLLAILGMFSIVAALGGCPAAENKEKAGKQPKAEPATPTVDRPGATTPWPPQQQPQPKATTPAPVDQKPAKSESAEEKLTKDVEQAADKPRDLGPPLVDHPENLTRLNPEQPIWLNRVDKQIVLQGEVCKAGYPLEFFATYSNRAYEAVVAVNVKPWFVHAALVALGAKPGHPAKFQPEFSPPTGTEVAIEVRWKDAQGNVQSCPAQHWVRNIKTRKELDVNWVFAGSAFVTNETTGEEYYQANSGELICVLNSPVAMLDLPVPSYAKMEDRPFEAFAEHLPPTGTPVTLLLKPILRPTPPAKPPISDAKRAEAEQKALEAAAPWLDLADRGEYSQCWETSAGYLKQSVDRHEFIKLLSGARSPLGKVVSRQLESKQFATSLPGVPDGQYVLLRYKTSFEHKKSAIETIAPMLDKDKKWRVSGYYIK